MKGGYLREAWLVLVLAVCFGSALAGVQVIWGPKIEANKENDARGQVGDLVPRADKDHTAEGRDVEVSDAKGRRLYRVYRAFDKADRHVGWVIKAKGPGYADDIEVLIGLDAGAETITGLSVLAQNETPGVGSKITGGKWRSQFAGKPAGAPLEAGRKGRPASKGKVKIDAIAGATVSSNSVCAIVNRALADMKAKLAEPD